MFAVKIVSSINQREHKKTPPKNSTASIYLILVNAKYGIFEVVCPFFAPFLVLRVRKH